MKRGEVYWVRLDPIEGSEQAGTRPGVIVSRNAINQYSPVVVICPLTSARHLTRLYPSDVLGCQALSSAVTDNNASRPGKLAQPARYSQVPGTLSTPPQNTKPTVCKHHFNGRLCYWLHLA